LGTVLILGHRPPYPVLVRSPGPHDNDRVTHDLATPSPLVGRTAELARLVAALDAALAGAGTTVLVSGEAGIGKTRLVGELAARARTAGATVLTGRCIDLVGSGLPYLAFTEAFRPLPGSPIAAGSADMRPLFEQVRLFVAGLAETAPLALLLDDLHWADLSTLDLLSYLAHATAEHRVLIVGTYRTDELRSDAHLRRMATELVRARRAIALHLGPLPAAELAALVERDVGSALPVERKELIVARSGGNPFFAEELCAAAGHGDDAVPGIVREAMLQRLSRLDADARTVLELAAGAGRPVDHQLLRAATGFAPRRLDHALRQAVEHSVLVADQPPGTLGFRHALLAETVYSTLLPGEREQAHARFATALADRADARSAGELAEHWAAAGRPAEALGASMQAATAAEAMSGRTEALRHLERVIATWPVVPDAPAIAGASLADVLARAADLAHMTGSGPRAAELVRAAIDLVDAAADPVLAGLLYERLGTYLLPTGDHASGLAAFRRAVDLVPPEPPTAARVQVLAAFGNALLLGWQHAAAGAACAEAIEVADAIGETRAAFRARDVLAVTMCYLGEQDEGARRLRAALDRSPAQATLPDVLRPYVLLSDALTTAGRLEEAVQVAADGLALARRFGIERGVGTVLASNAAEAMLAAGRWAEADAMIAAALRAGGAFWNFHPQRLRALLATWRGEIDVAHRYLADGAGAATQPNAAHYYYCLVAELALWEGRIADAVSAVGTGLRAAATDESTFLQVQLCALGLRALADRAQLAAAGADHTTLDRARNEAGRLLRSARRAAGLAATVSPDAEAWLAVAEAEYDRALGTPSPERWQQALVAWQRLGRPYHAAYCGWRAAEAYLSSGSPVSQAIGAARAAYAIGTALGARPLQHELELLGRRARIDLAATDPAASGPAVVAGPERAAAFGLTAREDEVLALLARGYTNREIADTFTISVKTASVHVSHILRKLGVTSRFQAAELAHRAAARPLLSDRSGSLDA